MNDKMNELIAENVRLQAEVWRLKIDLEQAEKSLKPLRKAFTELLDDTLMYRERMGLEMGNSDYEYDWMDKGGLL
jgi:hypothetical protein